MEATGNLLCPYCRTRSSHRTIATGTRWLYWQCDDCSSIWSIDDHPIYKVWTPWALL